MGDRFKKVRHLALGSFDPDTNQIIGVNITDTDPVYSDPFACYDEADVGYLLGVDTEGSPSGDLYIALEVSPDQGVNWYELAGATIDLSSYTPPYKIAVFGAQNLSGLIRVKAYCDSGVDDSNYYIIHVWLTLAHLK